MNNLEASTIRDYSDRELIIEFKRRIDNESIKIDISPSGAIDFIASENLTKEQHRYVFDKEKAEADIKKALNEKCEQLMDVKNADDWAEWVESISKTILSYRN